MASDDPVLATVLAETGRMRRLAVALLRGTDEGDADDIVQEASVAALARAPRGGDVARWLHRVTRHLAIDRLRRAERRAARERAAARGEAQQPADEIAGRLELHRDLVAAVAALPDPQRRAIVRRFFDGAPPSAIARELGEPVATVKTRLQRGLTRLRAELGVRWGSELGAALVALVRPITPPVATVAGSGAIASGAAVAGLGVVSMSAKTKLAWVAAGIALAALVVPVVLRGSRGSGAMARAPTATSSASAVTGAGASPPEVEAMAAPTRAPEPREAAAVAVRSTRRERLGEERVAELAGRVVDQAGAPVAGAEVEIVRDSRVGGAQTRRFATADAEGRFRFDDLVRGIRFTVHARADDGRRGNTEHVRAGRDEVVVTLFPTATVCGVVVDAHDGQPVMGAVVRRWGGARAAEDATGPDGRFELSGLELIGDGDSFLATAPDGRSSPLQFVEVRRGERAETTLRIGRADRAAIDGHVVDAEGGAAIAGATITGEVPMLGLEARSGADGAFRLVPGWGQSDGGPSVVVVAPGYVSRRVSLPPAAEPARRVEVELHRGARATGRVIAIDGTPVAGALVAARATGPAARGRDIVAVSGPDGRFELVGLATGERRHLLLVRHDECERTALAFPREPEAAGTVDLGEIRLGRGALVRGRVVDDAGMPLAAYVEVVGLEPAAGKESEPSTVDAARSFDDFFDVGDTIHCDGVGRFDLAGVPVGRWRLRASASGFVAHVETTVVVEGAGVIGDATIVLARGRTIAGRVVDERGQPIAGATIWATPMVDAAISRHHRRAHGFTTTLTGSDGRFLVAGLPDCDWNLEVQPPAASDGGCHRNRTLERVEPGSADLEIVLEDGAPITGHVRDASGKPLNFVLVTAVDAAGATVASAGTGLAGSFHLIVPPDVELRLEVRPPGSSGPFAHAASRAVACTIESVFGGDEPLEITLPIDPAPRR